MTLKLVQEPIELEAELVMVDDSELLVELELELSDVVELLDEESVEEGPVEDGSEVEAPVEEAWVEDGSEEVVSSAPPAIAVASETLEEAPVSFTTLPWLLVVDASEALLALALELVLSPG